MKLLVFVAGLAIAVSATANAATLHVDAYNSTVQGWSGGGTPVHEVLGGSGDGLGYLRVPSAANLATFNVDSRWTGNYAAIGAGRVVVDLRVPVGQPELAMRVVLFGPSTNQQRYTSAAAQTIPADGVWREYAFSLNEADLVPTQVNNPFISYSQIMAGVIQVMLRHDPNTPSHLVENVTGELHVDNVTLASAPIAGDFDGNGLVNAEDLTHPTLGWRARYGTDLNGKDFLDWQRALNVPVAVAVPEPCSCVLVAVLATALFAWQPRRRRSR